MTKLSSFNGETGESRIYSKYDEKLLFETIIPIGEGDFDLHLALEKAIRAAEEHAYWHGFSSARSIAYQALDDVLMKGQP